MDAVAPQRIILGSASAPRRLVLSVVAPAFEVRRADIDERSVQAPDVMTLPVAIAKAKAAHLLPSAGVDGVLVTADQVVVNAAGELRHKPTCEADVIRWLDEYAGSTVRLISAVVVTDLSSGRSSDGVDVCTVRFHCSARGGGAAVAAPAPALNLVELPWANAAACALAAILDEKAMEGAMPPGGLVAAADCAGAIALEHPALARHIKSIDGSPDSAMGLPLALLSTCLGNLGWGALAVPGLPRH